MPPALLRTCSHPDCETLTLGELCLAHELPVLRTFSRGRPYRRSAAAMQPGGRTLTYSKK